jgi:hypothetical protein
MEEGTLPRSLPPGAERGAAAGSERRWQRRLRRGAATRAGQCAGGVRIPLRHPASPGHRWSAGFGFQKLS